ncbi:hypothetical protein ACFSHT_10385 [Paraburkholderia silviterrae]|uniref:Uncharacterized protein n=1 Tax=Paraburkholderia silviterrae TaxID=2528715 RepID=A0A4R5MFF0_9BURK|nr:hypothetical protein [Paraburkholderia silviterrae]TDG25357.1 hypothetical protein EYW47_05865 [Paraburkholderia silviterrae]
MAKIQTAQARVLADNAGLGLKCDQVVTGPEAVIKALAKAGAVDDHPDAVAYATKQGAKQVELADPDAAAEVAEAAIEEKQADGAPNDPAAK